MAHHAANVAPDIENIKRSPKFYFSDLYIQIADTLFKVNRRDFEYGSKVYANRPVFDLPTGQGSFDGATADSPLVLEGVTASEMEDFLEVLYPPLSREMHRGIESTSVHIARWRSVLKLSQMFDFGEIYKRSLTHLFSLTAKHPLARLRLHSDFVLDAEMWLVPALASLIMKPGDLTVEEGEQLGMATAIKIATLKGECSLNRQDSNRVFKRVRELWDLPPQPPHTVGTALKRKIILRD